MITRLKYISNTSLDTLRNDVRTNIRRYVKGSFSDLVSEGDWSIELALEVDLEPLADLDPSGTPEAEVSNSKLVWRALGRLSPSLAYEEGIWARLAHVECLDYARQRWLPDDGDEDTIEAQVRKHFFAETLTNRRDDNAISRLWWNAYIADRTMPGSDLQPLEMFLAKADFRQSFVERSETGSRPVLAAGIIRIMQSRPWVTAHENNFRVFMKKLNQLGGGIVFEAMTLADVDAFMLDCALRSGMADAKPVQPARHGQSSISAVAPPPG
jgi:Family of unknown function (DUF6339)